MEYIRSVGWWNCSHRGKHKMCRLKGNDNWDRCHCIPLIPSEDRQKIFYKYYEWDGKEKSKSIVNQIKKEIEAQSYKLWLKWKGVKKVSVRTKFSRRTRHG